MGPFSVAQAQELSRGLQIQVILTQILKEVILMLYDENTLTQTLRNTFGFAAFRAGQCEAISTLLNEGHLLCIHPTGFGKSLLYQLPAVMLEGLTVVISPLLALMRDQQIHLNERFKIAAASINSDQTEEENYLARQNALNGNLKILFVAPEQLDNLDSLAFLGKLSISLIVVDEAHCISTWGHDFRPSYRQILNFIRSTQSSRPQLKILGLTATADRKTEEDMMKQLSGGHVPIKVLRESMNRPNISLTVFSLTKIAAKLSACLQFVNQIEGCGLIYCATRENAELVSTFLKSHGVNAAAYHAGLESDHKRILQNEFIQDKFKVIAATNALGMGIDKSNLRFIIHFDVPGSITAYYQEVGRCGRDGLPAMGIMLYNPADRKIQEYFIHSSQPSIDDFNSIMSAIANSREAPNLTSIKRTTGLHPTRVTTVIAELMEQEFIAKTKESNAQVYKATGKQGIPDLSRYAVQLKIKMRELHNMLRYAEHKEICLMEDLRQWLGDATTSPCGHCGNCRPFPLTYQNNPVQVETIDQWLNKQTVEIGGYRTVNLLPGIALLDAKLRSPIFMSFMHNRASSSADNLGIPDELLALLKWQLQILMKAHNFALIAPLPSRTWGARDALANMLGSYLNVPVSLDLLAWKEEPSSRQGFLLNNDQRQENVQNRMGVNIHYPLPTSGTILLFDDYTGSGATLKEAARALRKEGKVKQALVPLTIAAVKWKLASPGMV